MRYKIIGDDSAPTYFEIDQRSGDIKLKASVARDTQTMYQIRVQAYDNGVPSKSDDAVVKVTVNRNLNAPKFTQASLSKDILYAQELGTMIVKVAATDADEQEPHNQVRYYLIGDTLAQQYFMVNDVSGEVTVRKDLAADSNTRYTVSSLIIMVY